MTFDQWKSKVDAAVFNACGLSCDDLSDVCYADMFDDDVSPRAAAADVLRENGFES